MAEYIAIAVLSLALIALAVRHLSVKRQINNINSQLKEDMPHRRSVSIELFDDSVESVALTVNNLIEEYSQKILEAEKDNQYLKNSIADISHDMRTPLTSIIGYLQLLSRGDLGEEQRQYLDIALEKSGYLRKLLADFYELSTLTANNASDNELSPQQSGAESNRKFIEKVDLAGIVSEVIIDNANEFSQKGIKPVFEMSDRPVFILGNVEKLHRVIQNIVENGLRYSCGDIVFRISGGDGDSDGNGDSGGGSNGDGNGDGNGGVRLTIENQTRNINEIDTTRLFDRFYRADISRSGQGTGLGLSIAKLLTESMGGSIDVCVEDDLFIVQLDFRRVAGSKKDGNRGIEHRKITQKKFSNCVKPCDMLR